MNEKTKTVIHFFRENAKENAVKCGAGQIVDIRTDGVFVKASEGENYTREKTLFDFCLVSSDFTMPMLIRMFESVCRFPEGSTLIFTHSLERKEIEYIASEKGFRVYEHFSVSKVTEEMFGEKSGENLNYCAAVKK